VLGRIPPHLLGGEIPLDAELAAQGIDQLAAGLGLSRERVAEGILEIAAWSQANAVRQVSVKRGLDVREYALVAIGGSGPLLAGKLVDLLELHAGVVPPSPGNVSALVSALGLLTVDLKNDYVITSVSFDDELHLERAEGAYQRLEAAAREALVREGFSASEMRIERAADMRYFGQAWEVRVEVPSGQLTRSVADAGVENFHAVHEQVYGFSYRPRPTVAGAPGAPAGQGRQRVEWVNLRVTGVGPMRRPPVPAGVQQPESAERARTGTRPVHFDGAWVETPVYDRAQLGVGDTLAGPAIVEEHGSTTVVFPGVALRVDGFSNLILSRQ
jgi:N-methylhydantoinase A